MICEPASLGRGAGRESSQKFVEFVIQFKYSSTNSCFFGKILREPFAPFASSRLILLSSYREGAKYAKDREGLLVVVPLRCVIRGGAFRG